MKNLWFIFIGFLVVFMVFFVSFFDFKDDNLINKIPQKKVQTETNSNQKDIGLLIRKTKHNTTKETIQNDIQQIAETEDEKIYEDEIEKIYEDEIERIYPNEHKAKPIQQNTQNIEILNLNNATKIKMKIKAKERDGIVKARVSITHDMLTYNQAKKKGKEANFITHIIGRVGQRVGYDTSTSQFLSKNPFMKFSFLGKKGEVLTIIYQQLKGETFYDSKKIK